jgi:hypothetical protein
VKFVGEIDVEDTSTLYLYDCAIQLVLCGGLLGGMHTSLGVIVFV